MLEFKVIENLKPNKDLTNILKEFKYKVKLGQIKTILHTNLQVVIPTEYQITYPTTLTILEYKVNEISNKPFILKNIIKSIILKKLHNFEKILILDYTFCLFVRKHIEKYIKFYFVKPTFI